PDELAVGFESGQRTRPRAGRQHDVRRGEIGRGLTVFRDGELVLADKFRLALEYRDLVLAHQMRDAVRQLLRDRARAGDDLFRVVADVVRREAELIEMVQ